MPKAILAAAELQPHHGSAQHPPPQSPASLQQPESPAPFARALTSRWYLQPLRLHIATAAQIEQDHPAATKDHAPRPYFAHDILQPHTATAPLSLQSR